MRITTLATCLWLTLLGPIALAQSVTCDHDRAANFSRYKTYAWARSTGLDDPLSHARVVEAIDAALAGKGLTRVEPSVNPDVLVAYRASFDTTLDISEIPKWSVFGAAATVHSVSVGTLVVEMTDANANTIVWRSRSSSDFRPGIKPEKRDRTIAKSAKKMFKNYPPKP